MPVAAIAAAPAVDCLFTSVLESEANPGAPPRPGNVCGSCSPLVTAERGIPILVPAHCRRSLAMKPAGKPPAGRQGQPPERGDLAAWLPRDGQPTANQPKSPTTRRGHERLRTERGRANRPKPNHQACSNESSAYSSSSRRRKRKGKIHGSTTEPAFNKLKCQLAVDPAKTKAVSVSLSTAISSTRGAPLLGGIAMQLGPLRSRQIQIQLLMQR